MLLTTPTSLSIPPPQPTSSSLRPRRGWCGGASSFLSTLSLTSGIRRRFMVWRSLNSPSKSHHWFDNLLNLSTSFVSTVVLWAVEKKREIMIYFFVFEIFFIELGINEIIEMKNILISLKYNHWHSKTVHSILKAMKIHF